MPKRQNIVAPNYGGGLNTSEGPEISKDGLSPTQLTQAYNWRFTGSGGCSTRTGFELQSNIGTSAKIDNLWTHEPYSVMFGKSDTAIYQTLDGLTWYTIGVTRTATETEDFSSIEKDVHVTNATDSYTRIAVSTISAINSGAGTMSVRVGDGGKFASATFYVRGTAITGGTISGDNYTGLSGLTGSMAIGDIVTQTTAPSGAPKATCLGLLEGATLAGGVSANRAVLYYSAHATPDNPEFAYDYSANGASFKFLPTDIVDIGSITGGAIIALKKGLHYASTFEVTSEELLTTEIHVNFGGINNKCLVQGQKMTYLLDARNKRIIPIISDVNGVSVVDDPLNQRKNLDYPVQGFMSTIDTDQTNSGTSFDPVTTEVKFTVIKNGISYDVVFQENVGRWSIDLGKNFRCRALFNGRIWAGSDSSDDIYLENEGYTDNGVEINHRLVSAVYTVDDKRMTMEFLNFICGGILSTLGEFTLRMYVDDTKVFDELITADELVLKGLMSRTSGTPIGAGTVGDTTIGSGGTAPTGYRFTCPYDILFSGESYQFEIEIMDEGTQMELRDSRLDFETENETILSFF